MRLNRTALVASLGVMAALKVEPILHLVTRPNRIHVRPNCNADPCASGAHRWHGRVPPPRAAGRGRRACLYIRWSDASRRELRTVDDRGVLIVEVDRERVPVRPSVRYITSADHVVDVVLE